MLDPRSWDDSNDSHYLALYKQKKALSSVLALCFTQASETYHHWRVFANGSGGVSISFDRDALLTAVEGRTGLRTGNVQYLKLTQIRDRRLKIRELPFLKRYAFENENEFRIVFEDAARSLNHLDIPVPLSCIDRVTLSPWIARALSNEVKAILRGIVGCAKLEIVRSTLIGNEEWKNLGESAK